MSARGPTEWGGAGAGGRGPWPPPGTGRLPADACDARGGRSGCWWWPVTSRRALRRAVRAEQRPVSVTVNVPSPDPGVSVAQGFTRTRTRGLGVRVQRQAWHFRSRCYSKSGRLRALIAMSGVVVFVGPNGSGKSLFAVENLIPTLDGKSWECQNLDHMHNSEVAVHVRDCAVCDRRPGFRTLCLDAQALLAVHGVGQRRVASTLPLLDRQTGRLHDLYLPLTSARQLPHLEHCDVFFDEVAGISDADSSSSTPGAIKRWLQQLRKRDVRLFVTTPAYDRCSLPIRQIAKVIVDCRSFYSQDTNGGREWMPTLGMTFEAFDAFEYASFDKSSAKRQDCLAREYYWREDHDGMYSYDTLAQVNALVEVDESGACVVCSGSRGRAKCGCPDDVALIPPSELVVVEIEGERGGKSRKGVRREEVAAVEGVTRVITLDDAAG